jgi:hypothetical protein
MVDLYFDPVSSRTFVAAFQFAIAQTMISQRLALYNFPRISQLLACLNVGRLYAVLLRYAVNRFPEPI